LQPPAPKEAAEQEHELMALIEKKHACAEHEKACYVHPNGTHYQYTMEDLAIWAALLVSTSSI
jgi:hypothetical protein